MIEWRSGCCGAGQAQYKNKYFGELVGNCRCNRCSKPCDLLMYENGVRKHEHAWETKTHVVEIPCPKDSICIGDCGNGHFEQIALRKCKKCPAKQVAEWKDA